MIDIAHTPYTTPWHAAGLLVGLSEERNPAYVPRRSSSHVPYLSLVTHADAPPAALSPSDHEVVASMARGDDRAATVLYDRYASAMFGLALRVVGESADAEEVVLDAFAQAWRDAARFDGTRGSVLGWLTTITRTRALDLVRARGRRAKATDAASTALDEPAAMGTGYAAPDALVQDAETTIAVHGALQQLPVPQRQAIELAFYEGLTHHEVAERLQQPLGTIKTRIRLGMLKLRETLSPLAPERAS